MTQTPSRIAASKLSAACGRHARRVTPPTSESRSVCLGSNILRCPDAGNGPWHCMGLFLRNFAHTPASMRASSRPNRRRTAWGYSAVFCRAPSPARFADLRLPAEAAAKAGPPALHGVIPRILIAWGYSADFCEPLRDRDPTQKRDAVARMARAIANAVAGSLTCAPRRSDSPCTAGRQAQPEPAAALPRQCMGLFLKIPLGPPAASIARLACMAAKQTILPAGAGGREGKVRLSTVRDGTDQTCVVLRGRAPFPDVAAAQSGLRRHGVSERQPSRARH